MTLETSKPLRKKALTLTLTELANEYHMPTEILRNWITENLIPMNMVIDETKEDPEELTEHGESWVRAIHLLRTHPTILEPFDRLEGKLRDARKENDELKRRIALLEERGEQ